MFSIASQGSISIIKPPCYPSTHGLMLLTIFLGLYKYFWPYLLPFAPPPPLLTQVWQFKRFRSASLDFEASNPFPLLFRCSTTVIVTAQHAFSLASANMRTFTPSTDVISFTKLLGTLDSLNSLVQRKQSFTGGSEFPVSSHLFHHTPP